MVFVYGERAEPTLFSNLLVTRRRLVHAKLSGRAPSIPDRRGAALHLWPSPPVSPQVRLLQRPHTDDGGELQHRLHRGLLDTRLPRKSTLLRTPRWCGSFARKRRLVSRSRPMSSYPSHQMSRKPLVFDTGARTGTGAKALGHVQAAGPPDRGTGAYTTKTAVPRCPWHPAVRPRT